MLLFRVGVLFAAAAAFGQVQMDLETRVKMQMEIGGKPMPANERLLRKDRIMMQSGTLRMEAGGMFLLNDTTAGTILLARTADKSYIRATVAEFVAAVKSQRASLAKATLGTTTVEMLEPPVPPPYLWREKETTARGCRYRMKVETPAAKEPVIAETSIFIYSVPLQGAAKSMMAAQEPLQLNVGADPTGGATGLDEEALKAITSCVPRDRLIVRMISKIESKSSAPMEMRVQVEMTFDTASFKDGPVAEDLFSIPKDWTVAPPESLKERVMQYLKGPAAIQ